MDSGFPYFGQVNSFNIALYNRKMKVLRFFYVLIYIKILKLQYEIEHSVNP